MFAGFRSSSSLYIMSSATETLSPSLLACFSEKPELNPGGSTNRRLTSRTKGVSPFCSSTLFCATAAVTARITQHTAEITRIVADTSSLPALLNVGAVGNGSAPVRGRTEREAVTPHGIALRADEDGDLLVGRYREGPGVAEPEWDVIKLAVGVGQP